MKNKSLTLRNLLDSFFRKLKNKDINFAVIGNYQNLPYFTENDVDIWVASYEESEVILHSIALEQGLKLYLNNKTANGSNNYFFLIEDDLIEVIKIDLMIESSWYSFVPIIKSSILEKNIIYFNDIPVVNETIENCGHLLYPLLTFGKVKQKYKNKLHSAHLNVEFELTLINILGKNLSKKLIENLKNKNWSNIEKLSNRIKRKLLMNLVLELYKVQRIKIVINFINSIFLRTFKKTGLFISFTGIDGVGKTSIKNYFLENCDKYFIKGKTQEFYWRPFLLPKPSVFLNKKKIKLGEFNSEGRRIVEQTFKNRVLSYIKYCYYILDFKIGVLKYFKNLKTGGLIIFDRYHFDNIIYPERFGFVVNSKFMKFIDRYLIPQPDILFYLTANSKTLYERKRELNVKEIDAQKKIYEKEIRINPKIITISSDCSFESTVNNILTICLVNMANRLEKKQNG